MTAYAFWNNKGGVGKTFLCFVAASEYAHKYPNTDVYVIDLCPQANLSEILLGGSSYFLEKTEDNSLPKSPLSKLISKSPRATVAGYIEARLNSPFRMIEDVNPFVCQPSQFNKKIPTNLKLVCGDNLLELLSEPIRQTSQLSIPKDSWKQVLSWIKDLCGELRKNSGDRDTVFFIDCPTSFTIYTQLALVATNYLIIPFIANNSFKSEFQILTALLYGVGDKNYIPYAKINFSKQAKEFNLDIPKLYLFVNNRITYFNNKPSKAFFAMSSEIKKIIEHFHGEHRSIFANPSTTSNFMEIPDYHTACIVSATTGTPLHQLKEGIQKGFESIFGESPQLNEERLDRYRSKLLELVERL